MNKAMPQVGLTFLMGSRLQRNTFFTYEMYWKHIQILNGIRLGIQLLTIMKITLIFQYSTTTTLFIRKHKHSNDIMFITIALVEYWSIM